MGWKTTERAGGGRQGELVVNVCFCLPSSGGHVHNMQQRVDHPAHHISVQMMGLRMDLNRNCGFMLGQPEFWGLGEALIWLGFDPHEVAANL